MATLQYLASSTTTKPTSWLNSPTVISTSNSGDLDGLLDDASEFDYLHLRLVSTSYQGEILTVKVNGVDTTFNLVDLGGGQYEYYAYVVFPDADAAYEGTVSLAYNEISTTVTTVNETRTQGAADNPSTGPNEARTETLLLDGTYGTSGSTRYLEYASGTSYTFKWTVYDTSASAVRNFSYSVAPSGATSTTLDSVVAALNAVSSTDLATWSRDGSDLRLTHNTASTSIADADFDASLEIITTTTTAQSQSVVIDTLAPAVSSVAITAQTGGNLVSGVNYLNAGDIVTVTVTMSQAVVIAGGTPTLALNIGGSTVNAAYISGTTSLLFRYTILADQTDANGISIDADGISLNGATIKDANGNNAILSFVAVADNGAYVVDTTAPSSPSVALQQSVIDGGASATEISNLGTVQGEAGGTLEVIFTDGDYTVANERILQTYSNYTGTAIQLALTASNIGTQNGRVGNNSTIKVYTRQTDAAGNEGVWTEQTSFYLDIDKPNAPVLQLVDDTGEFANDEITNNPLTEAAAALEAGATLEYFVGGAWTETAPTTFVQGDNTVTARQVDAAGNASDPSNFSFTYDTIDPAAATNVTELVTLDLEFAAEVTALTRRVSVVFKQGDTVVEDFGYLSYGNSGAARVEADGDVFINLNYTNSPFLDDGDGAPAEQYQVLITVEDLAGNVTTQSYDVEVDSNAPPIPKVTDFVFVTPDNKWRHDVGALGYLAPALVATDPTASVTAWVQAGNQELIEQSAVYNPSTGLFELTPTYYPNNDGDGDPATNPDPVIALNTHYGVLRMSMAAKDTAGNILETGGGQPAVVSLIYGANAYAPAPAAPVVVDGTAATPDTDPTEIDNSTPGTQETATFNFDGIPLFGGTTYQLQVGTIVLSAKVGRLPIDDPAPTLAQLVIGLQADADYGTAPFTIAATGTNLVVTWNDVGNQAAAASFRSVIDDNLTGENTFNQVGIADLIVGYAGNDQISGQAGNDYLFGGADSDTILGGVGDDYIAGGTQKDYLTGGDDNDRFVYSRVNESGSSASARDVITDFTIDDPLNNDVIDLSEISRSLGVALAFSTTAFTANGRAGSLRANLNTVWFSDDGCLYANVNGNNAADFAIQLRDPLATDLVGVRTFLQNGGVQLA